MLRRATSRKRLQGIFWQNAGWCQDERAHGIRKGSLLVSCSQFIFGEGIRGSDFQSRTLATSYRVLSEAVVMRPKTSSGKHGIRTHMAIETARFSKSARQNRIRLLSVFTSTPPGIRTPTNWFGISYAAVTPRAWSFWFSVFGV